MILIETHTDANARAFLQTMRNIFIMSQLMSEIQKNSTNEFDMDTDRTQIMLQLKNYAYYLTMQLSVGDIWNYLVKALNDCGTVELLQMIGGCLAGWISYRIPVCVLGLI
jgi:hypothetical protein